MYEFQAYLSRLYTDDAFRALHRAAPEAAQGFFDLDEVARRMVSALDLEAVEVFARSLGARYRAHLESLYPIIVRTLPNEMKNRCFSRFISLHWRSPGEDRVTVVTKLGAFIEEFIRGAMPMAHHLAELARFERIVREIALSDSNGIPSHSGHVGSVPSDVEVFAEDDVLSLAPGARLESFEADVVRLAGEKPDLGLPAVGVTLAILPGLAGGPPRSLNLGEAAARLLTLLRFPTRFGDVLANFDAGATGDAIRAEVEQGLRFFVERRAVVRRWDEGRAI